MVIAATLVISAITIVSAFIAKVCRYGRCLFQVKLFWVYIIIFAGFRSETMGRYFSHDCATERRLVKNMVAEGLPWSQLERRTVPDE